MFFILFLLFQFLYLHLSIYQLILLRQWDGTTTTTHDGTSRDGTTRLLRHTKGCLSGDIGRCQRWANNGERWGKQPKTHLWCFLGYSMFSFYYFLLIYLLNSDCYDTRWHLERWDDYYDYYDTRWHKTGWLLWHTMGCLSGDIGWRQRWADDGERWGKRPKKCLWCFLGYSMFFFFSFFPFFFFTYIST